METANKLFAFVPSMYWSYCGGVTLICADSPEEAVELGNKAAEIDEKHSKEMGYVCILSEGGHFALDTPIKTERSIRYFWVLTDTFELSASRNKGVILSNANHA